MADKPSIDEWAAQFGAGPTKTQKPEGLRAEVETPAQRRARLAKKKKQADQRTLRQKIRDRKRMLDKI